MNLRMEMKKTLSENWVVQSLEDALTVWNDKLTEIWQLVTQSPQIFRGGAIWQMVVNIHRTLQAIGYALLVLFFWWGLSKPAAALPRQKGQNTPCGCLSVSPLPKGSSPMGWS